MLEVFITFCMLHSADLFSYEIVFGLLHPVWGNKKERKTDFTAQFGCSACLFVGSTSIILSTTVIGVL